MLVGDPRYYCRLGFNSAPGVVHEGVPPQNLLLLALGGSLPRGTVHFHQGFLVE